MRVSVNVVNEVFEEHRKTLFGIAYRMLGSVADAEDIVQDAWLRWNSVRGPVENPKAYLARTVTNLCLNRMQSAAVRRETYVGQWLPEPLITTDDVAENVEMAESVSLGMLVVMERLTPLERAVFVLREVFGYSHDEIAEILGRSPASVRQVAHRARSNVQARRPRFETSEETQRRVTDEFLAACFSGDPARVMRVLAPDVTVWSDGGGKRTASRHPLHGADRVAKFLLGVARTQQFDGLEIHIAKVNGQAGLVVTMDGELDSVAAFDILDGKIAAIRIVRNPDKLRRSDQG